METKEEFSARWGWQSAMAPVQSETAASVLGIHGPDLIALREFATRESMRRFGSLAIPCRTVAICSTIPSLLVTIGGLVGLIVVAILVKLFTADGGT